MSKIKINQGRVMSSWFRYVFTLLVFCASFVILVKLNNPLGFIIICALAFVLIMSWTSFYMVEIDSAKKEYGDYTVVMGRKYGDKKVYPGIDHIFIKKFNTTQSYQNYGTGIVHRIKGQEFQGYLRFSDDVKLELVSDEKEDELMERLEPIANKLGTSIRLS